MGCETKVIEGSQAEPATRKFEVPWSEETPYRRAAYLSELVMAASRVVDSLDNAAVYGSGLSSLMTVLEERASALCVELDAPAFDEDWPATSAALSIDPTLGFSAEEVGEET